MKVFFNNLIKDTDHNHVTDKANWNFEYNMDKKEIK